MESSEAIRRIFWRHRWLLIILMILPAAAAALYFEHKPVMFTATAQVQGQSATPSAATEIQAIQGRVSAVATDPSVVRKAMTAAGVSGNATQVARHQITVKPLGSSAVMSVTVTEPTRAAAMRLAGALATTVVTQIDELGTTNNPALAKLNASTQQLSAKRDALNAKLNAAEAHGASVSSIKVQSLLAQLSAVEQQLSSSMQSAQQLLASDSTGAAVLAMPAFATGASRHAAEYGALAGLLGLVIGLLIATIRESIRPTVAEPSAGARELGTVLLGHAEARGEGIAGADDDLTARLDLAAQRLGLHTAVLAGPVSAACLKVLAGRLQGSNRAQANGHRPLRVMALPETALNGHQGDAALVAVLPPFAPHRALDRIMDLGVTTGWPVLGVIGLRTRRSGRPPQAGTHAASDDGKPVADDTIEMGAAT